MNKRAFLLFAAMLVGATAPAWAVGGLGSAVRVDKDPGGSTYKFGLFTVARTPVSGFAVAWEEDSNAASGIERLRYRIFKPDGKAAAAAGLANIAGHSEPAFTRILPLGTGSVYFVYAASLPPPGIDEKGKREVFGQVVNVATGAANGPRRLLNPTSNEGETTLRISALRDGRAVAGWSDDENYAAIRGRFVNAAGVPQSVNLQFACCQQAQLFNLEALGTGFLGTFRRASLFPMANELYGRIFKSNGAPLSQPKKLPVAHLADFSGFLRALANGKILLTRTVPSGSTQRVVAQFYTQTWQPSGGQKVLIADLAQYAGYTLVTTPDSGFLLAHNKRAGSAYSITIQRLNASLVPVGSSFTIATDKADGVRLAVLSANRAAAIFHRTVAGRPALLAQLLSY